jgi:hypothetical protein
VQGADPGGPKSESGAAAMTEDLKSRQQRQDDTPKTSDQLPEEGPAHQVADDVPGAADGAARETGRRHAQEHSHNAHEPNHKAPERSARQGGGR